MKWYTRLIIAFILSTAYNYIDYQYGTIYYPSTLEILFGSLITLLPFYLGIYIAEKMFGYLTEEERAEEKA